jgi:hypothetical protein
MRVHAEDNASVTQTVHRIRLELMQLNAEIDHDCEMSTCSVCDGVDHLADMIEMAVRETFGNPVNEKTQALEKLWATV